MTSGKKKYSTELKLEIVKRYLHGNIPLRSLASEYTVSLGDIQKCRDAYLQHGIDGLETQTKSYTGDFKIYVVEYMHNSGLSLRKTAAYFNIPSRNSIAEWERIYKEQGKEALYINRRGKSRLMKNKKQRKDRKSQVQNKALLAELLKLRMENEYLKKLYALVQERERSK